MAEKQLPPLDVVSPSGDPVTITSLDAGTSVAELAASLGVPSLGVDGEALDQERPVADTNAIRRGAQLTSTALASDRPDVSSGDGGTATTSAPDDGSVSFERPHRVVEVAVIAGPACSLWRELPVGRHVVGRARHADLVIADPVVEPHHALLDVDDDANVALTQLAGSVPMLVDGEPVAVATNLADGSRVTIGASLVELRIGPSRQRTAARPHGGSIAAHVTDPWRRMVWRSPDDTPAWNPTPIAPPHRGDERAGPALTSLVGAVVAALGAVVIATVMNNAMFLVFAGIGALAALSTWCVGAIAAARQRRGVRRDHRGEVERFRHDLDRLVASRRVLHERRHRRVAEVLELALDLSGDIWSIRTTPVRPPGDDPRSDVDTTIVREPALVATLGVGTARWHPPVDGHGDDAELVAAVDAAGRISRTTIPITLVDGEAIALHGSLASGRAVARSIVAQLATLVGPADWRLVVVTSTPDEWAWVDWLPHGVSAGHAVVCTADREQLAADLAANLASIDARRRTLVVTDEPTAFTTRTGPLRRMLAATGAASLVVVDTDATVPAICRRVVRSGTTGRARLLGETPASDDAVDLHVGGITIEMADRVARRLACLVDPEDDDLAAASVPTTVTFADVSGGLVSGGFAADEAPMSPDAVLARWRAGGHDPAPRTPIGWSSDGLVEIDLVRDGPHGLIAGTTGSGKSELLRSLVLGLALHVSPEHLNLVLVDYKGGSTFDACVDLPHTVGLVTDLDDGLAERALVSLGAELHRREHLLRTVGASDLAEYRSRADVHPIARLVVVIDEFAALAKELPEFLAALVDIAQRGRSLGVHLLLATQRPAGVVNDDIRANTNLRLALRLHDRADAVDVVGDPMPAAFPRGAPGRSALRLGPDELVVFQAARCTGSVETHVEGSISVAASTIASSVGTRLGARRGGGAADASASTDHVVDDGPERHDEPSELERAVHCISAAADAANLAEVHRPWLEPLPFPLPPEQSPAEGIGVVDDPAQQRRRALTWAPTDGSLALIGSLGSGTTSTLISLAASACRTHGADELHLYVVDARGDDGLGALASLAHCGGVVGITEHERLHRLFARLVGAIDRRLGGDGRGDPRSVVVMIDGWSALRSAVSHVERTQLNDLVGRVLHDGPGVGIVTVVADGATPASAALSMADRWVFHLDDPADARSLGIRLPVGDGRPGRLRIASSGLEAQVAVGAAGLAEIASRDTDPSGPPVVDTLPVVVDAAHGDGWASGVVSSGVRLMVGIGGDSLRPDGPTVPHGDPILVVGAARTGVSTTVERCVAAAAQACSSRLLRVDRRTTLDEVADVVSAATEREPVLIVIDDAHRVDDDARGTLAAVARGDHPAARLIIGARADAVRSGYGHWAREAARARCGIVMANRGGVDGDVLGVDIPRRPLVVARPGLGWIVDGGPLRQVQVAASGSVASVR